MASRVRVPQGELMLMFLPRIRGPGGGTGAVELRSVSRGHILCKMELRGGGVQGQGQRSRIRKDFFAYCCFHFHCILLRLIFVSTLTVICSQAHLRRILAETDGSQPTNMVMLPNGGILLMSLKPYEDTNGGYFIRQGDNIKGDSVVKKSDNHIVTEHVVKSGELYTTTTQTSAMGSTPKSDINVTENLTTVKVDTTTEFVYPEAWKDTMPKFGVIPSQDEADASFAHEDEEVTTTEVSKSSDITTEWTMPVFPFGTTKPLKTSTKTSTTTIKSSTSSTTKSIVSSKFKSRFPISLLNPKKRPSSPFSLKYSQDSPTISKLFNNEIDVHKPKFKIKKPLERSQQPQQTFESTFIPISSNQTTSRRNLTDLYERLKSHYIQSQENMNTTLRKRYRIADDDKSKFDNVNVVVPGNQTILAAGYIVN